MKKEKKLDIFCTVEGCNQLKAPGNRFLCKKCFKYYNDNEESMITIPGYERTKSFVPMATR